MHDVFQALVDALPSSNTSVLTKAQALGGAYGQQDTEDQPWLAQQQLATGACLNIHVDVRNIVKVDKFTTTQPATSPPPVSSPLVPPAAVSPAVEPSPAAAALEEQQKSELFGKMILMRHYIQQMTGISGQLFRRTDPRNVLEATRNNLIKTYAEMAQPLPSQGIQGYATHEVDTFLRADKRNQQLADKLQHALGQMRRTDTQDFGTDADPLKLIIDTMRQQRLFNRMDNMRNNIRITEGQTSKVHPELIFTNTDVSRNKLEQLADVYAELAAPNGPLTRRVAAAAAGLPRKGKIQLENALAQMRDSKNQLNNFGTRNDPLQFINNNTLLKQQQYVAQGLFRYAQLIS